MFSNVLVNIIGSSHFISRRARRICYRLNGLTIRGNVNPGAFFRTEKVKIGYGTFVNNNCFFENNEVVEIGAFCHIAMEVLFCTSSHEIGPSNQRGGKLFSLPIKIGNGCWVGARSTILPGVTIGEGCVIAAGSVVTKDCEPNSLYAGVPAKKVKDLPIN